MVFDVNIKLFQGIFHASILFLYSSKLFQFDNYEGQENSSLYCEAKMNMGPVVQFQGRLGSRVSQVIYLSGFKKKTRFEMSIPSSRSFED